MITKFIHTIKQHNLIKEHDKVIVGLSGGPDSVCLFYLLCQLREKLNFDMIAAHMDHGWRATSQQDVLFCKELAGQYHVPFISKHALEITIKKKLYGTSKEELGRTLRRQFFADLLASEQANSIALAHHWDDQVETFFIRLIRGCSVTGLSCMQIKQNDYIRPLLDSTKQEMLKFLHENKLVYLIDETNDSDAFLRNKMRKYLVPTARQIDTRFDTNLKKVIKHIQDTNHFIARLVEKIFEEISETGNEGLQLNKEKFLATDPYLHKSLLIIWLCKNNIQFPVSNAFFNEIITFLQKPNSGVHQIHKEWSIVKNNQNLTIKKCSLL